MTIADIVAPLKAQSHIGEFEIAQATYLARKAFPEDGDNHNAFLCLLLGLLALLRKGSTVATPNEILELWPRDLQAVVRGWLDIIATQHGEPRPFALVWEREPNADDILHPLVVQGWLRGTQSEPCWGFSRMWLAESELARSLRINLEKPMFVPRTAEERSRFMEALHHAMPAFVPHVRQWMAVMHAMVSSFCVISGGPGTGKTTIVRMLVKAVGLYRGITAARIVLCAPTGRAKARLLLGVQEGMEPSDPLRALTAQTLYALLGLGADGEPRWNHANPLPYDLVVVDEASMVDVWMFAKLMDALAPGATLVLVGDMDQLPSVEAGAVLGDLTASLREQRDSLAWPPELRREFGWLLNSETPKIPGLNQDETQLAAQLGSPFCGTGPFAGHVSFLTENQRSKEHPEILNWWNSLPGKGGFYNPVMHYTILEEFLKDARIAAWIAQWSEELEKNWALPTQGWSVERMAQFDARRFADLLGKRMVLCCVNDGPMGRHAVNFKMEEHFRHLGCAPIMVERNTSLGDFNLYNGDLGMRFRRGGIDYGAFVAEGRLRTVELRRLPQWSLAYAITVHKSQGSEFTHVLLLLPGEGQPEASRQLVYTGATRAKQTLWVNDAASRLERELLPDRRRSRFVDLI